MYPWLCSVRRSVKTKPRSIEGKAVILVTRHYHSHMRSFQTPIWNRTKIDYSRTSRFHRLVSRIYTTYIHTCIIITGWGVERQDTSLLAPRSILCFGILKGHNEGPTVGACVSNSSPGMRNTTGMAAVGLYFICFPCFTVLLFLRWVCCILRGRFGNDTHSITSLKLESVGTWKCTRKTSYYSFHHPRRFLSGGQSTVCLGKMII